MFQSILKKASSRHFPPAPAAENGCTIVNDIADSEYAQSVISQASALSQATQRGLVSAVQQTAVATGSGSPLPPNSPPLNPLDGDAPVVHQVTDAERIALLTAALEKARVASEKTASDAAALKTQNASLETQLKELRLKAKLKITQLHRELDEAKSNPGNIAAGSATRPEETPNSNSKPQFEIATTQTEDKVEHDAEKDVIAFTELQELRNRVAAHEAAVQRYDAALSESNGNVAALQQRAVDLAAEVEVLHAKSSDATDTLVNADNERIALLEQELSFARVRICELEDVKGHEPQVPFEETLADKVAAAVAGAKAEFLTELDQAQSKVSSLEAELAAAKNSSLQEQALLERIKTLENTLKTHDSSESEKVAELSAKLGEAEAKVQSLQFELTAAVEPDVIAPLYNRIKTLEDALDASVEAYNQLSESLQKREEEKRSRQVSESSASTFNELNSKLNESQAKVKSLEAEIAAAKTDVQDSEETRQLREKVKSLEESLHAGVEAYNRLSESLQRHEEEKRTRQASETAIMMDLKAKLESSEAKASQLEEELSAAKSASLAAAAAAAVTSTSQSMLRELESVREKNQNEIASLRNQLTLAKDTLSTKEGEIATLQASLEVATKQIEESMNGKTFLMDEQIMDLKIQIATRQNEITSLLESQEKSKLQYATLAKESEEKIRKLKGLLAQASKSLQDSKKAVNEKDAEVERLNSQVEQLQNECVNLAAKNSEQNSVINRLQIEIQDDRDIAAIKANEYEIKCRNLQSELTVLKSDFQSYKIKAHTALQQSSVIAFEAKVLELEEHNSKLEREKSEIMQETVSLNERVETMSAELNSALDQLVTFETQMKKYEGLSRELTVLRHEVEVCNRRMEAEHQLHAEALQARDNHHKTQLEHLRQDAQRDAAALQEVVAERVAELRAAQAQIDALTSSVAAAQAEAAKAAGEADRARAIAAQASAAAASGNFAAVLAAAGGAPNTSSAAGAGFPPSLQSVGGGFFGGVQPSPILSGSIAISPSASRRQSISAHNSVRESFADLLSKGMLGGEGSVRTTSIGDFGQRDREELIRNSQKISEMLADAEEQILKLREQEQILKEEIRKKERAERREELLVKRQNVEYLKNIVLSFLETDAKEQLIPVITKVLELSPDEVKRVRASMMGMEDEKVRANLPNFGFF